MRSTIQDLPCPRIPDPYTRVERSRSDAYSVERDCVDLTEMTRQYMYALARLDIPHSCRGIVTARDDDISMDLNTSDARLMPSQSRLANSSFDVPDSERHVARSGNGSL